MYFSESTKRGKGVGWRPFQTAAPLWEFSGLDKLDFAQMPQSVYEFIVCILRHFTAHLIYLTAPEKSQGGRYISDRDTLIFFSDLEFFGYALYAIVYICNTIWYRITRLGNSRVTEQTKTSKIRRKIAENQFPLLFGYFSITEQ